METYNKKDSFRTGLNNMYIQNEIEGTNKEYVDNQLKAILSIDSGNNPSTKDVLLGIENKSWIQVGVNERIFGNPTLSNSSSSNSEPHAWVLKFELSSLMSKELVNGETLFAGIEHQNYNVRTQEIPLTISKSVAQIIDK